MKLIPLFVISIAALTLAPSAQAQKPPEVGYVFPAGGKAGASVEVHLGGYDWTPDIEFYVHDKRVQLLPTGTPGPIIVPGPPYWFGAKGRITGPPLPREVGAKFVIPADIRPGPIFWQAANANGASSTGVFIVGSGPEAVEDEKRKEPQSLVSLPVTVSGRLMKIEEVDRYRFTATKDGPITCDLMARRLGAKFLGIIEVRDQSGKLVADADGASGTDPSLTFAAKAGAEYVVGVHDIDFGGDRSYVYRLSITPGPRVVGSIPAVGRRGETREVEFVGFGVATGTPKLESVKRQVAFPAAGKAVDYRLETPFGTTQVFQIPLSDLPEVVASPARSVGAVGITGVLDQADAEGRRPFDWKKGEIWSLEAQARRFGSPLDVALAVIGPDGKELARNDDLPETTDAGLNFTVPADGTYQVVVTDVAGKSGTRAAIYRLAVQPATPDFTLQVIPPRVGAIIGERSDMTVRAVRKNGFKGPIKLSVSGLPDGVNVHPALSIPADKTDAIVHLHADRDIGVTASFATVEGTGGGITRPGLFRAAGALSPRYADEPPISAILIPTTLKKRFTGRPVDADTGRKVHRGTTFPAEVNIERLDGFRGDIILQMAAQQSYQSHGITGGDVVVPFGVDRPIYPCYMPEWLETTRTSRMGMIAVAKVTDPRGKVCWLASEINGFITMTLEGALLKVSAEESDLVVPAGQAFDVHLRVSRLAKLAEPARLELMLPEELTGMLKAQPVTVGVGQESAVFRIESAPGLRGSHTFKIRATAIQDGKYPVISEATVAVEFIALSKSPR